MIASLVRALLLAACLLPALGLAMPGRPGLVATFASSCDSGSPHPRMRAIYTAEGKPHARPASTPIEMFGRGAAPERKFVKIGDVSVLASDSRQAVDELTDWAKRGARQIGGDAIVNVGWNDAASVKPPAGPVGLKYLTADVVRWQ